MSSTNQKQKFTRFKQEALLLAKYSSTASRISWADWSGFPPKTPQLMAGIAIEDKRYFSASFKHDATLSFNN